MKQYVDQQHAEYLVFLGTVCLLLVYLNRKMIGKNFDLQLYTVLSMLIVGLDRTVVSISHCGCDDPGSIPGLDRHFNKFSAMME